MHLHRLFCLTNPDHNVKLGDALLCFSIVTLYFGILSRRFFLPVYNGSSHDSSQGFKPQRLTFIAGPCSGEVPCHAKGRLGERRNSCVKANRH
jgi:hypothetical protein